MISIDNKATPTMLARTAMITAVLWSSSTAASGAPPNIVVIVADDLGWNAVGYHNPQFGTPHIDRLVSKGVELQRFYVAPMCTPTRAGLMTGRYPIRFGMGRAVIPPHRDFGLPSEETTLAELLQQRGYVHRGVFGKWHLGHRRAQWHPLNHGFTRFHGHYNGAIDYFRLTREGERDWHEDFRPSVEQGYATDLIAGAAAAWIRDVATSDTPYFCYVPFNAPHSPFQAPSPDVDRFRHLDEPQLSKRGPARQDPPSKAVYAAMVSRMDEGIGRVLQAIEASGKADNTLVWFFSDNGGVAGIRNNNAPLRGSKLTVYEGGIRVPACLRWPDRIAAGSVFPGVCGYIDVLPTLAAASGDLFTGAEGFPLDGFNLLPKLTAAEDTGHSRALPERPWFSWHGQSGPQSEHLAVTYRGWKLKVNGPRLQSLSQLSDGTNTVELFHLADDPVEEEDLREQFPQRVQELGRLLVAHRALQPKRAIPRYSRGQAGFVPPDAWELDPRRPHHKVGTRR